MMTSKNSKTYQFSKRGISGFAILPTDRLWTAREACTAVFDLGIPLTKGDLAARRIPPGVSFDYAVPQDWANENPDRVSSTVVIYDERWKQGFFNLFSDTFPE